MHQTDNSHPPSLTTLPRRRPLRFAIALTTLTLAAVTTQAAPRSRSKIALDSTALHRTYLDGDFDILIQKAEALLKTSPHLSSPDSLFVHKHLAVVYAKNPEKRELAKYHMLRVLKHDENANLYDMDASDEVYGLFERVKAENEVRLGKQAKVARPTSGSSVNSNSVTLVQPPKDSTPSNRVWRVSPEVGHTSEDRGKSKAWLYWLGGISAVGIGVGVTAYLWPEPDPKITTKNNTISTPASDSP